MKHFSIDELLASQEKFLLDFSHPHCKRGGLLHLDLFHSGIIETQEVLEYRDNLARRLAFGNHLGPILVKESFMEDIGDNFGVSKNYRVVIPTEENDSLFLSDKEEAESKFIYFLDFLGTKEFYLHNGEHTMVCFEEPELFTSETVQKADTIVFHQRGLGALIYTKTPLTIESKYKVRDVAQQLVLMENFNKLYANRYVEEKGIEFVGLVAKILYDSGLDILPSKQRSTICLRYDQARFWNLRNSGVMAAASTVTKSDGKFYMSLSLGSYIERGFGPHEAPAFASALFLLLKSESPHIQTIKGLIDSIDTVDF